MQQWESAEGRAQYFWYTIQTDQMVWNSSFISQETVTSPKAIVDSGTTLNYLPSGMQPFSKATRKPVYISATTSPLRVLLTCPPEIAQAINNAFVPRAVYDEELGGYAVACDATPPSFGVKIGGQMIWTEPSSMILPEVKNQQGQCLSGITETDQEPYILGDTFMQGLVAVFDVDNLEMRFAKRT